jgi:hypothetical protein
MNEKEFFKPFRAYDLDYKRLKRWYLASLYSYEVTANHVDRFKTEPRKPGQPNPNIIYYKDEHLIGHHKRSLIGKFKRKYVDFLEEMTLIRIISILEDFLMSVVKTAFYYDKNCFHEPRQTIEFQISEFLSKDMSELEEKYIDGKVSNLHRQGFGEVRKFYKKTFDIDFNDFVTQYDSVDYRIKDLVKIHDIRHLLVHRLGKTDAKFQSDYKYTGKQIVLEEEEVILYLQIIDDFVNFLRGKFKDKWF